MKNKKPQIKYIVSGVLYLISIGLILLYLIQSSIFMFQNPDMTELRRFIEFPELVIYCISGLILLIIAVIIRVSSNKK